MSRLIRIGLLLIMALVLLAIALHLGRLVLAPTREASIDAVRVRNSLVAELGTPADVAWSPSAVPETYNWEQAAPPEPFAEVVATVLGDAPSKLSDFEAALRLARHIRANHRPGRPIQANSWQTYLKLTSGQGGYCSDFTQTINALALTAGLKVREWGFTWQSLANGHAFNEIWEPSLEKWLLLDSHHGFYVVDTTSGVPLSALEYRAHLLSDADSNAVTLKPISEEWFSEARVEAERRFYAGGVARMFLLMGNNVFSYDAHPLIQLTESLPRSVEMLTAIVLGQHPRFLFVPPDDRPDLREEVEAMAWIRTRTFLEIAAAVVCGLVGLYLLITFRPSGGFSRRRSAAGGSTG